MRTHFSWEHWLAEQWLQKLVKPLPSGPVFLLLWLKIASVDPDNQVTIYNYISEA